MVTLFLLFLPVSVFVATVIAKARFEQSQGAWALLWSPAVFVSSLGALTFVALLGGSRPVAARALAWGLVVLLVCGSFTVGAYV